MRQSHDRRSARDQRLLSVIPPRRWRRASGARHIHFRMAEGEIVGLLGRTGSGKSTLLRLIAGLAEPTYGSITYLGHRIDGPPPGVSMVFQSFALFPWLTVLENVQLG